MSSAYCQDTDGLSVTKVTQDGSIIVCLDSRVSELQVRLGLIQVGQGGGSILDRFAAKNESAHQKNVLPFTIAMNPAKSDLMGLKSARAIPADGHEGKAMLRLHS